jgi:hypothetical protein
MLGRGYVDCALCARRLILVVKYNSYASLARTLFYLQRSKEVSGTALKILPLKFNKELNTGVLDMKKVLLVVNICDFFVLFF